MTEDDWDRCTDPQVMLGFLQTGGRASTRKQALLAIASIGRVQRLLREEQEDPVRRALKAAELRAEGEPLPAELATADTDLNGHPIVWAEGAGWDLWAAATPFLAPVAALEFIVLAVERVLRAPADAVTPVRLAAQAEAAEAFWSRGAEYAAAHLADHLARLGPGAATLFGATFRNRAPYQKQVLTSAGWEWEVETEVEEAHGYAVLAALADALEARCRLVRDVVGSPFRPPPVIDPRWLSWNAGAVVQLAQAAYNERLMPSGHLDPTRVAVLADALEEAGAPKEVLAHLRAPGPHWRGCWAVDLLLGKA